MLSRIAESLFWIGRYIERSEIADLVTFLVSDESRMISGATMVIDAAMAG